MKSKFKWLTSLLTVIFLLGATTALFLYAAGYRIQKNAMQEVDLTKTGMINAKSIPEGANVYVDGVLKGATNGQVAGVEPGAHNLRIVKNGYVTWSKDIEVFPELVTDITSVLIAQSPRLEPLTNTGARFPTISPSLTKLAFFSKDGTAPGVWVIPLSGEALSLFRSNPYVVLEDVPTNFYSKGKSIEWAPDEDFLLVEDIESKFFLVDLTKKNATPIADPATIRAEWKKELTDKRLIFIEKLDLPEDLKKIAVDTNTIWAPDEKKFLYLAINGDKTEYRVYNMEKPIPIGEKVETIVFTTTTADKQPKVSWYADSFHLLLTEADMEKSTTGKISLIRIDGTNKTELYSNTLHSDRVLSSPGGDKIVILTSFKSEGQTDLYTIGIR